MQNIDSLNLELEAVEKSIAELEERKKILERDIRVAGEESVSEEYQMPLNLDSSDISRYSRQLLLPEIGPGAYLLKG
ncbi:hypothetical protein AYI68_g8366 [Smittium mucronatum]|uniref:Uncharacterized protein n=1 Tax=Smittium mucronatum TaxID=133383 RepID=A0A1R0GL38_9FUNG|nr:hypothetical protein AYI68_g8366 [Smittium mucronatum]